MKAFRILLGLIIILFSSWLIVSEQLAGASADATINARVITLQTPISGQVELPPLALGARVSRGQELALVRDERVDADRLNDLQLQLALESAALNLAAEDTVLPEGSSLQTPFETDERHRRIAALQDSIRVERQHVNRMTQAFVRAPANGQLWQVYAAEGTYVRAGERLVTMLDCSTTVVTLSVTELTYNKIAPGQRAEFRPTGSDKVFRGVVTRMAGVGAERVYETLAVAPTAKHLERYDIALLLPDLRRDSEFSCAIGQTGRAFFSERPLDVVRKWISSILAPAT